MGLKYIDDATSYKYNLEVYECENCGYHVGIDATYLEQVGSVVIDCPGCNTQYIVDAYEKETM